MTRSDANQIDRVTSVLGPDGLPSVAIIKSRGWRKRITPDFPSSTYIEWICGVATIAHVSKLLAVSINGDEVDRVEEVPVDERKIMRFLVEQSYASTILAVGDKLYMYKDSSDRFCIFFGDGDTISSGFGLTDDASDKGFLEWVSKSGLNESEARNLIFTYEVYRAS